MTTNAAMPRRQQQFFRASVTKCYGCGDRLHCLATMSILVLSSQLRGTESCSVGLGLARVVMSSTLANISARGFRALP
jgi:hypothetical protein